MAVKFEDLSRLLEEECTIDPNTIRMLRRHREELEACDNMDTALSKVMDILSEAVAEATGSTDAPDVSKLNEETQEYMEQATAVVEKLLDSQGWHYGTQKDRPDLAIYEMNFKEEHCTLRARIHVEANPEVCCVEMVLPIKGDELYEYPICQKITKFNYSQRYGVLKYDERDGEISCEYSFRCGKGIDPDELFHYLQLMVSCGDYAYQEIRKCCAGRFSREEVEELKTGFNAMLEDIRPSGAGAPPEEEKTTSAEDRRGTWRARGLCQHCGGRFKGLFTKKCEACGREKDY